MSTVDQRRPPFVNAERFARDPVSDDEYRVRAPAALKAIRDMRAPDECEQTGRELMEALARTRVEEGRPF